MPHMAAGRCFWHNDVRCHEAAHGVPVQVAAWRAGNHQLRSDLNGKVESAAAGLAARVEAVEVTCRQHTQDLQVGHTTP